MPPVLLIPGNMCDERLWYPVAERLVAAGCRVQHAPRLGQNSIVAMAQAVLSAIDEPVTAVGFSMGAIVAAEMARQAPERVGGLGLIAFNASADLPERAAVRPRQQAEVRQGGLAALVADELKPNYLAAANRGDPVVLDTVMQMALALGPDVFVAQSEALRLRDDLRPVLPRLTMPVMLACGGEDRLCTPEWHRCWATAIGPGARFAEIPNAGHLLPLEQPHLLADALLGWLAEDTSCHTAS
jgi:pimeloyl-ACP methyl ester carboxylesterase